jgi:hypothetical protein
MMELDQNDGHLLGQMRVIARGEVGGAIADTGEASLGLAERLPTEMNSAPRGTRAARIMAS